MDSKPASDPSMVFRRFSIAVLTFIALALPAKAKECTVDLQIIRDILAEGVFTDKNYSISDPAAVQRNKESLQALNGVAATIVWQASHYVRDGSVDDAACALDMLAYQARGGAMLGKMSSLQAGFERKFRTAGLAIAYLELKDLASARQRADIEPWLSELADKVAEIDPKSDQWNNHHYWAGLVATAVGAATDDPARTALGRQAYEDGLSSIQADGSLPQELTRRELSFSYHVFGLAPLIMAAEIAAHQGDDWYSLQGGAIHRLVARVAAGMADPDWFRQKVGVANVVPTGPIFAWRAFYERRFPGRVTLPPTGPCGFTHLGGDLNALARRWLPPDVRSRASGCPDYP